MAVAAPGMLDSVSPPEGAGADVCDLDVSRAGRVAVELLDLAALYVLSLDPVVLKLPALGEPPLEPFRAFALSQVLRSFCFFSSQGPITCTRPGCSCPLVCTHHM